MIVWAQNQVERRKKGSLLLEGKHLIYLNIKVGMSDTFIEWECGFI